MEHFRCYLWGGFKTFPDRSCWKWTESGKVICVQQEWALTSVSQYAVWYVTVNIGTCVTHVFCDNVHMRISVVKLVLTSNRKMLQQAFDDETMSYVRCFEWHSHFQRGRSQGHPTILTYNALNFLDNFKGCAREAFQGLCCWFHEFDKNSYLVQYTLPFKPGPKSHHGKLLSLTKSTNRKAETGPNKSMLQRKWSHDRQGLIYSIWCLRIIIILWVYLVEIHGLSTGTQNKLGWCWWTMTGCLWDHIVNLLFYTLYSKHILTEWLSFYKVENCVVKFSANH